MNRVMILFRQLRCLVGLMLLVAGFAAHAVQPMIAAGFHGGINMLHADGTVWTYTNKYEPTAAKLAKFAGLDKVVAIAGDIALKDDGTVWELLQSCRSLGEREYHCTPSKVVKVTGIDDVVEIAAAVSSFRMARKRDGSVWVWSQSINRGAFGIPDWHMQMIRETPQDYRYPREDNGRGIMGPSGFENDISKSAVASCGCDYWTLRLKNKIVGPRRLDFLPPMSQISTNGQIAMALTPDKTLYVWGVFRRRGHHLAMHPPEGDYVLGRDGLGAIRVTQFKEAKEVRLWRDWVWADSLAFHSPRREDAGNKYQDLLDVPRFKPLQVIAKTDLEANGGSVLYPDGVVMVGFENMYHRYKTPFVSRLVILPLPPMGVDEAGTGIAYALLEDGSIWAWDDIVLHIVATHLLYPVPERMVTDDGIEINLNKSMSARKSGQGKLIR